MPQEPTEEQYAQLEKAGQLAQLTPSEKITINPGTTNLKVKLPRKAVSLLVINWTS